MDDRRHSSGISFGLPKKTRRKDRVVMMLNCSLHWKKSEKEVTCVWVSFVQIWNNKLPFSYRTFSPVKQGCHNPVCQVFNSNEVVKNAPSCQWRYRATRRLQLQRQISSTREIKIYFNLNVFQKFYWAFPKRYWDCTWDWPENKKHSFIHLILTTARKKDDFIKWRHPRDFRMDRSYSLLTWPRLWFCHLK